jgi:4-amino-4-deoxy-L-arabinose transferase-like glycosyltransferase
MRNRVNNFLGRVSTPGLFIIIFTAALSFRLIFLAGISRSPVFNIPIIDEQTYSEHALKLLETGNIREGFFWQSPFYPFFLTAVYSVLGRSIAGVKIIQLIIGSLTSGMVFLLGERIFGRKEGIAAAVITILCGPLLFFETKLLASAWAAFWVVALLLLFLRGKKSMQILDLALLGLCCGLAAVTRANLILFIIPALLWLIASLFSSGIKPFRAAAGTAVLLAAALAVLITVSALSYRANEQFSPLPQSGSLNIYLGNNPNTARTLMIRPGMEWKDLIREPTVHGARTNSESREYFARLFREYVVSRPFHYMAGLLSKTAQFFSSREMPRNIDPYTEREFSLLYSLLIWKLGGFGFPFGVIIILAVLGIIRYRARIPAILWLFLVFYPLSVILVFVASRYRVPYIPVLALPAAAGLISLPAVIRNSNRRRLFATAAMIAALAFAVSFPGPFPVEKHDYRSEMYCNAGFVLYRDSRLEEAASYLRQALRINPNYSKANKYMGLVMSRMNRTAEAVEYFRTALEQKPDSRFINYYLGVHLLEMNNTAEGISYLKKSSRLAEDARDHFMAARIRELLERYSRQGQPRRAG